MNVLERNDVIPLSAIVSNKMGYRKAAKGCWEMGYGIINPAEDDNEVSPLPTLFSLGLSNDKNKETEFCKLLEKFQPDIVDDAENFRVVGQLQPIFVRPNDIVNVGGYDVIFGMRRILMAMYLHCKYNKLAEIRADIVECDDAEARIIAFSKSRYRPADPIEMGLYYEKLRNTGLNYQEVAILVDGNWQMIRRLAKIATSDKLSKEQKDKVSCGEMGLVKAYEIATTEVKSPKKKTKQEIRAALKSARNDMEKFFPNGTDGNTQEVLQEHIETLEWVLGK